MSGSAGLSFGTIHPTEGANWIVIRLRTAGGLSGFGEATLGSHSAAILAGLEGMRQACNPNAEIVGEAVRLAKTWRAPDALAASAVRCAIAQCELDLRSRQAGQPASQFLGAASRADVALYANINQGLRDRSPESFAQAAKNAAAAGFAAIKIAPCDGLSPSGFDSLAYRRALDRIAAVRAAVCSSVLLMIDCHWRFAAPAARQLIEDMTAIAPYWIECPLPEDRQNWPEIRNLRRLANMRGIKLAGAEKLTAPSEFDAIMAADCYDVIMPDVKYAGSPAQICAIAERATRRGIAISLHNPSGPVAHLVSLAVSAAIGGEDLLEHQFAVAADFGDLVGRPDLVIGGRSEVPVSPGLGIGEQSPVERLLEAQSDA